MKVINKELLVLEVLWQEKPGVAFDLLNNYMKRKVGFDELNAQFPISEQLLVLDRLIGKGLVGRSSSATHQTKYIGLKRQLQRCPRVNAKLAAGSFTITRKGVSAILNLSGYDSTRYFEVMQAESPQRSLTSYLVTTSAPSRMEEIVTVLSGLSNYYGSIRSIGNPKPMCGWTTRRGVHSKRALVCQLDFDANRSDGLNLERLRLAHHCLLRNRWWRQIGFDAEECLFNLSLGTQPPIQVGERYWGECEDIVRNANAKHVSTVHISKDLFGSLNEKTATLLFRGFPWETVTAHGSEQEAKFCFSHSSVGPCKLLLFNRLVGTVQVPGSYTVSVQPSNGTFDVVQEYPVNNPDSEN